MAYAQTEREIQSKRVKVIAITVTTSAATIASLIATADSTFDQDRMFGFVILPQDELGVDRIPLFFGDASAQLGYIGSGVQWDFRATEAHEDIYLKAGGTDVIYLMVNYN